MVYAVVESGGKQYVARSGETIDVDRLSLKEGEKVTFESVLLIAGDGAALVGSPHVEGAKVVGHVVEEFKGPKVVVFKYKPKIRYRKRQGHRQLYTRVAIDEVVAPGSAKRTTKKAEAEEEPAATKAAPSAKAQDTGEPKASTKKSSEKADTAEPATKAAAGAKKTTKTKKPAASTKKSSGTSKAKKAE